MGSLFLSSFAMWSRRTRYWFCLCTVAISRSRLRPVGHSWNLKTGRTMYNVQCAWSGCGGDAGMFFLLPSSSVFVVLMVIFSRVFLLCLTSPNFLRLTSPNSLLRTVQPSVEPKTAAYTRMTHDSSHELYLTSRVGAALRDGGG
jgi:hypothetical protein